uniref:Uncharacterized protein n=1 Tax=Rhizophora mucronata TaxID=61149 RepID=A0A2P2QPN3_RHIMU
MVWKVIFRHGEKPVIEVDEAGVGHSGALSVIKQPAQSSCIEKEQSCYARMAMELANCFRKHWSAKDSFLL